MFMNKLTAVLLCSALLSACANRAPQSPTTINFDSKGQMTKTQIDLDSADYVRMMGVQQTEQTNQAYFRSQEAMMNRMDSRDIPMFIMAQALSGNRGPTNYNDVLLQEQRTKAAVSNNWFGLGKFLAGGFLLDRVSGNLFDAISAGAQGVKVIGDNNELRGTNVGDYNRDSGVYREEIGGIPLNPGELEPVVLGGPPEEEMVEGDESLGEDNLPNGLSCPPGFNPRPDGSGICSDGMGGTADPI